MFACLGSCFRLESFENLQHGRKDGFAAGFTAVQLAHALSEDWQSVPDDVLQAMVAYLSPADVAVARLVCRHWRRMLSCYTPSLTLPTSFLATKGVKAVLRNTASVFPSVTTVALCHTGGWCDPVQARMDVEPLVQCGRRNVTLEPLAAAFSQVQSVVLSDASFTRQPWDLAHLALLPRLSAVSMSWDTGLWAPGQVTEEAGALQALFSRTHLTTLCLHKDAHLFLGEVPLGDKVLTSAAALVHLQKLKLSTVGASDPGFRALAALTGLQDLSLSGHLDISLITLSKVFGTVTGLTQLTLRGLLLCSQDLKCIAAACSGGTASRRRNTSRSRHGSALTAGSSSGSSVGSQQQYQSSPSGGAWRSSRLWQQQQLHVLPQAPHAPPLPPMCGSAQWVSRSNSSSSTSSTSSQPGVQPLQGAAELARSSSGSSGSSPADPGMRLQRTADGSASGIRSSSSRVRFRSTDWSVVFLPLRRLRVLQLQSDLAFLGSCAAIRSMNHVTHIELHGTARFMQPSMQVQAIGSLPTSWLVQLARDAAAAALEERDGGCSHKGSRGMVRVGGAWPGLKSLHVDNLQLADSFVQGVAHLSSLRTLIVSGPCLLTAAQQQQQQAGHDVGQWRQQQRAESAPTESSGLPGFIPSHPSPGLSSLSQQDYCPTGSGHTAGQRKDLHSPAALAAALVDAAASVNLSQRKPNNGRISIDIKGGSSAATATTIAVGNSNSQPSPPLFTSSGMRPQLAPEHAPIAAALTTLRQQQQPRVVFQPVVDRDVLTRLSPLTQLSKFELHLQQRMPCGMEMTPFALAHLAASWTGLTSLSLSVLAPTTQPHLQPSHPHAPTPDGPDPQAHVPVSAAAQLFMSLESLAALQHLQLTLVPAIETSHQEQGAAAVLPQHTRTPPHHAAAALPSAGRSSAPQHFPSTALDGSLEGHSSSYSSSGTACTAAPAAVASLPWSRLPGSLVSLSLSGFVGIEADNIKALADAAPTLRHLRLMYCQVSLHVLWTLHSSWPRLQTLVVKEHALSGINGSGLAAIGMLSQLVALAVTVEMAADASPLSHLGTLRYLLLDGRSNTAIRGIKGLCQLTKLKTLIMPLLHLHHTNQTLLSTLQLALPNTHISNVYRSFGRHHGCQWFACFSSSEREWWAVPQQPWTWRPNLDIQA